MFQDDFPESDAFPGSENYRRPAPRVPNKSFRLINVTPHSIKLVEEVVDRAADFDRAFDREGADAALEAYGDLVQAKGKLVNYMARLMDMANDKSLNAQRTSQVRFT